MHDPKAEKLLRQIEKLEKEAARSAAAVTPGAKSEKRGAHAPADKAPQRGHGPTPQPQLPVMEEVHTLDPADCTCPDCGKPLKAWESHFEESDVVDVVVSSRIFQRGR